MFGFAVARSRPQTPADGYWALARAAGGWRMELAVGTAPADPDAFARRLLGIEEGIETLAYHDERGGQYRFAFFDRETLVGALFLAREPVAASRAALIAALESPHPGGSSRFRVLAGRAAVDRPDPGPIVCSCHSVGANEIAAAILAGAGSVDAVGAATRAGTNCGSCRAEIRGLVDAHRAVAAE
jgi:assimilatory nitrate reductase catalytic subunit